MTDMLKTLRKSVLIIFLMFPIFLKGEKLIVIDKLKSLENYDSLWNIDVKSGSCNFFREKGRTNEAQRWNSSFHGINRAKEIRKRNKRSLLFYRRTGKTRYINTLKTAKSKALPNTSRIREKDWKAVQWKRNFKIWKGIRKLLHTFQNRLRQCQKCNNEV